MDAARHVAKFLQRIGQFGGGVFELCSEILQLRRYGRLRCA